MVNDIGNGKRQISGRKLSRPEAPQQTGKVLRGKRQRKRKGIAKEIVRKKGIRKR